MTNVNEMIMMMNMTETDSDITRDDRDEIVITKGYESYNEKL